MLSFSNGLHKCLLVRVVFPLSVWKVGWNIITLQVPCLSIMTNFNCKSLFKISREVKCYRVNVIFHTSIGAPLKYFNLTSFLSVLRRSSFIPEIIELPTIATVPFVHFLITSALLLSLLLTRLAIGWFGSLLGGLISLS